MKPKTTIRIDPETLHQARVAAVTERKTLGTWLEEAIQEKIGRGQKDAVARKPRTPKTKGGP